MEFRKKVSIDIKGLELDYQTRMMLFGSCFAENIGTRLSENKFVVNSNPFGVLYNPLSIAQSINFLLDERIFTSDDVVYAEGAYHSFYHHSVYSDLSEESFLNNINLMREKATSDLKQADVLLITFGTAYVYRHKQSDHVVANCHKVAASQFDHYRLSVSDIVSEWKMLTNRLLSLNSNLKILFTVSPIRHWKDGAHNNQLSKSTLLLAIDELSNLFPTVFYFPSYEIVMDELRDYRFYAADMIHPSDVAVDYIWQRFSENLFSGETSGVLKQWQTIWRSLQHRPLVDINNIQYKQFLMQTLLRLNDFRKKYPYFDCELELCRLNDKLAQTGINDIT